LARAALPGQADGLALADGQADPVDRVHRAGAGAVVDGEVLDLQQGRSLPWAARAHAARGHAGTSSPATRASAAPTGPAPRRRSSIGRRGARSTSRLSATRSMALLSSTRAVPNRAMHSPGGTYHHHWASWKACELLAQ